MLRCLRSWAAIGMVQVNAAEPLASTAETWRVNGPARQDEALGDGGVAEPGGGEPQHVEFPGCEPGGPGARGRAGPAGDPVRSHLPESCGGQVRGRPGAQRLEDGQARLPAGPSRRCMNKASPQARRHHQEPNKIKYPGKDAAHGWRKEGAWAMARSLAGWCTCAP